MKKLIIVVFIFVFFGGCSTTKKLSKSSADVKIEKDIQLDNKVEVKTTALNNGKSTVKESSTIEEINIKQALPIELTANFKIDSTATLRGDTALKLVDVCDKNISITIYQNGKTNELTAKIRSKNNVEDVPFREINIKKSTFNKETAIDTTKSITKDSTASTNFKDKSRIESKTSNTEKVVTRINYWLLIPFILLVLALVYFYNKK